MNGYRPIVELMNANFGIYGMAELSSAGNTYATTGGQFEMPMTIIGAGGTAPNQSLGAEHSRVLAAARALELSTYQRLTQCMHPPLCMHSTHSTDD